MDVSSDHLSRLIFTLEEAEQLMWEAFVWDVSPQGHNYWMEFLNDLLTYIEAMKVIQEVHDAGR